MRLLEFQAKRLFSEQGIPVPQGVLLTSQTELRELPYPAVLKAQVPVGGRGKAGGIRTVANAKDAASVMDELLRTQIKSHPVGAVLAERKIDVEEELYLSLLIDETVRLPLIMGSRAGGVDIESVAREDPRKIVKRHIDPLVGLPDYTLRYVAKALGIDRYLGSFVPLVRALLEIFRGCDATLVEINPLAVAGEGLLALDAKVILDDKAAYRHRTLFNGLEEEQERLRTSPRPRAQQLAKDKNLTYVSLEGDVGMISDGAGTGMLTLDLIHDAGGRAANFCELGGAAGEETVQYALDAVLADPRVRALLITLIGGLTRMDEVAEGIATYLESHEVRVPLVVRMCGTRAKEGRARLQEVGIRTHNHLPGAIRRAVDLAKGV